MPSTTSWPAITARKACALSSDIWMKVRISSASPRSSSKSIIRIPHATNCADSSDACLLKHEGWSLGGLRRADKRRLGRRGLLLALVLVLLLCALAAHKADDMGRKTFFAIHGCPR